MNHAGTALGCVAADMGSGKVQIFADQFDKQSAVFDFLFDRLAIYCHGHFRHEILPDQNKIALDPAQGPKTGENQKIDQ